MGRTYRRQDKKFKRKLKEGRRVRKNKRSTEPEEYNTNRPEDKKRENRMGSYLFT